MYIELEIHSTRIVQYSLWYCGTVVDIIVGDSLSWSVNNIPPLTSHHCLLSLQPKDKLTQNVNKFWNSSGNSENWKTYQLSFETEGKNQIELKEENKTVRSFISSFLYSRDFHFRTFYILYFTTELGPGWKKFKSQWISNNLFSFEFDIKFDIN